MESRAWLWEPRSHLMSPFPRRQAWAWAGSRELGLCLSSAFRVFPPAFSSPPCAPASLDACHLLLGPLPFPIQPLCPRPSSLLPPPWLPQDVGLAPAPFMTPLMEYPSNPPHLLWPPRGPSSTSLSQPQLLVLYILAWLPGRAPPPPTFTR